MICLLVCTRTMAVLGPHRMNLGRALDVLQLCPAPVRDIVSVPSTRHADLV